MYLLRYYLGYSKQNVFRWKLAEPFWSTAATHGRKVAFFNWHDCQLPGATVESPGTLMLINILVLQRGIRLF